MTHDFNRYPELTNTQMNEYYFVSPHKQITSSFIATVVNVHDGDTVDLRWSERDFAFPIRLANTAAPELNEPGGKKAQRWLDNRLLGKEVDIIIDPIDRVEKWGRLLGTILHGGQDVGAEEIMLGLAKNFKDRKEGQITNPIKEDAIKQ